MGTNAWQRLASTEPFALAVYADGTVITATGSGSIADPLPSLTIGRVANCRGGWAVAEFTRLAAAEMGHPGVTDQGTTVVTVQPMGAQPSSVSVYALGVGDGPDRPRSMPTGSRCDQRCVG